MTKIEFLKIISEGLSDFPYQELQDILYDYEEHFSSAISCGKSESEIIEELGDPYVIVNQYRSGYIQKFETKNNSYGEPKSDNFNNNESSYSRNDQPQGTNNAVNSVLKIAIIIFALVLFSPIVLGGTAGVFGILIAFLSVPFALSISGVAVLLSKLGLNVLGFSAPAFLIDFPDSVIILLTIGSIASTILMIIVSVYIIKLTVTLVKKIIGKISNKGVN